MLVGKNDVELVPNRLRLKGTAEARAARRLCRGRHADHRTPADPPCSHPIATRSTAPTVPLKAAARCGARLGPARCGGARAAALESDAPIRPGVDQRVGSPSSRSRPTNPTTTTADDPPRLQRGRRARGRSRAGLIADKQMVDELQLVTEIVSATPVSQRPQLRDAAPARQGGYRSPRPMCSVRCRVARTTYRSMTERRSQAGGQRAERADVGRHRFAPTDTRRVSGRCRCSLRLADEALDVMADEQAGSGVIEAVTGTGKTMVGVDRGPAGTGAGAARS